MDTINKEECLTHLSMQVEVPIVGWKFGKVLIDGERNERQLTHAGVINT